MFAMSARIVGHHHVTHNISRSNIDAARRFYRDILGLREIPATEDPSGHRLIWFSVGSQQLHLIVRDEPDPASSRHLAVLVDDFDQFIAHLQAHRVRLDEREPGQFWGRRSDGFKYAFCYDPEGNRIELMEKR